MTDVFPDAPCFADVEGFLFDLDGVITPTAEVHERAWGELFSEEFDYSDQDYIDLIDGKPRLDGVRDFLASRGVELPLGDTSDGPDDRTVWSYANKKNAIFARILDDEGVQPFPGTMSFLDLLDDLAVPYGLVSSSRNAPAVLAAAGMSTRFGVIVDGNTTAEEGLRGKPAPDGYLLGAERLGVAPAKVAVVEDAVSGVAAGAAGKFCSVIGVDRGAGRQALLDSGATLVVEDLDELLPEHRTMPEPPMPSGLDGDRFPVHPWKLVETAHNADDLGHTETLFGLANGYIGMRANPEEGRDAHSHGTYLNGYHETWDIQHAEDAFGFARTGQTIVNVPDAKLIKLYVDDEPLLLSNADLPEYERSLDFETGVLRRELVWATPSGKRVHVTSSRMLSFEHRHLAVMVFEVTLPDDSAPVAISSQLLNRQDGTDEYFVKSAALGEGGDPRQASNLEHRVLEPKLQRRADDEVVLGYRAASSGMTVATGARHLIDAPASATIETEVGDDLAKTVVSCSLQPGEVVRITKLVAYHSSTGVPANELSDRCTRTLERAEEQGVEAIEAAQREHLDAFWHTGDIEIGGDDRHQQAIRWNLFQLAQVSACANEQGIPAKGLSGGGYDGHYFWDTETYVVPFLAHTTPRAARKVLRFRWKTLDRARLRATEMNLDGALFPWRTINGDECSAYYAAGTAQYHIDAAVAYAIERYMTATADLDYLAAEGAEILIETARMWADLGFYGADERFHIHGVTGPDEYTTVVNDNTYTNVMASANMAYAVEALGLLEVARPTEVAQLCRRTGVTPEEIAFWKAAADAIFVPFDEDLAIHPQDANFLELEQWPWEEVPADKYPLLLNFHPLVIYRHQVLKQADVVLATLLRPGRFTDEERRRNFAYYDPITTGDSSLSAGVQAAAAALAGREELAWTYFQQALYLDLHDSHHNTADGVHIAASGGVWNAIVAGFLGFVDDGRTIRFAPNVPAELGALSTRLLVRGLRLRIEAEGTRCTITVEDSAGEVKVVDSEGRTHVLRQGEPVEIGAD